MHEVACAEPTQRQQLGRPAGVAEAEKSHDSAEAQHKVELNRFAVVPSLDPVST
jgi:hypothetical protein